jgi:hypothetical protein
VRALLTVTRLPRWARRVDLPGPVLPLAHAADGQAGAERDLARLRGAKPGARTELARAIAAVLGRDRDAVAALRSELTARRAAAAAARRYLDQSPPGWTPFASRNAELAARLRARPPGTCAG